MKNNIVNTMVQTTKQNFASLFTSALLAAVTAATPMTACAQAGHPANNQTASTSAAATASAQSSQNELAKLDTLPAAGRSCISATLGADLPSYHVETRGAGFYAAARGLDSDFSTQGVEISADSAHVRLTLDAYGHGDRLTKVNSASAARVSPNRVEYHRTGITEWYENGPLGLEQGFTVEQPEKNSSGWLTVALAIDGNMTATVEDGSQGVTWSDYANKKQFEYAGLVADDADGKELPSRLEVAGGRLLIKVDDRNARYPVTIDPYVYRKTFNGTATYNDTGISVAVDHWKMKDFMVVVGAIYAKRPGNGPASGVAYVFENIGVPWRKYTLYPADGQKGDWFGFSVSIDNNPYSSTEGKTIVVGAPKHAVKKNGNNLTASGKAYVYVKPTPGAWWCANLCVIPQSAGLVSPNATAGFEFGFSVSVQSNTAVVGEPQPYNCTGCGVGAAYVYQGGTWGPLTAQLPTPTNLTASGSEFGFSVSHSNGPGDLGIAVVGAPELPGWGGCGCGNGYAYVYAPTTSWSTPGTPTILSNPNNSFDWFGYSVASATGYLAVVGAPNATCPTGSGECPSGYPANTGLAWEYEANNGWTTPAAIYPSDGGTGDLFGVSVATDGKGGDCLVVGAPLHGSGQGEGYFFAGYWGAGGYYPETQHVTNSSYGEFGWSAACYYGSGAAVFGAPVSNSYTGAAYLYY